MAPNRFALTAVLFAFGCGAGEAGAPSPRSRAAPPAAPLVVASSAPGSPASASERLDAGPLDASAIGAVTSGAGAATPSEAAACKIPSTVCYDDDECLKAARPGCSARCLRRPWMPVAGHPGAKRPAGECRGTASPPCFETVVRVDDAGRRHYRPECIE